MKFTLPKGGVLAMAILMGLVVCSVAASATNILYTTLGPNGEFDTGAGYFVDGSNFTNQVIANQFTLGAGATVGDAVLALGNFAGGNNPVNAYIEYDASGLPGAVAATLTQVGTIPPFGGTGLTTFNCASGCALAAGSYWLVAWEPDSGTQQAWNFAYQDSSGNIAFNQVGDAFGSWLGPLNITQEGFRIDGASAPEPGSLVLLGSGVLGLAGVIRRKLM